MKLLTLLSFGNVFQVICMKLGKDVNHYLNAAIRENTHQSYLSAVRHFETEWKGFLPATADNIAAYLVDHAEQLSINTLNLRLAALAQWHIEQGFPDPTKAPIIRNVMKGIKTLHPAIEKKAKPFQLEQLVQVTNYLDIHIQLAQRSAKYEDELRLARNKALLLLGFWRGFRGDELTRLQIEHVEITPNRGMSCYFPRTKADRQFNGSVFKVPALPQLCPVQAYAVWIELSGLTSGPIFRGINRWGHISDCGLHIDSLIPLIRDIFKNSGVHGCDLYSTHSFRRGFANWASSNGWDLKTLMDYVGWKNINSALAYLDADDPFFQQQIKSALTLSLA